MQRTPQGGQERLSKRGESLAGALSGGFSRGLVAPLDVIKIRFQLQLSSAKRDAGGEKPAYTSIAQAARRLVREEGLGSLWRGNGAAILLWVAYLGIQFPVYRTVHTAVSSKDEGFAKSAAASLLAGAVAGGVATSVTYPLDWARTRLASQGVHRRYRGIRDVLDSAMPPPLVENSVGAAPPSGVRWLLSRFPRAWFQGLSPTLASIVPAAGVTFASYDGLGSLWDSMAPRELQASAAVLDRRKGASSAAVAADATPAGGDAARHSAEPAAKGSAVATAASAPQQQHYLPHWRSFLCGGAAGLLGKLAVYPLDTVKKRLQVAGMPRPAVLGPPLPVYSGTWNALVTIARDEGIVRGLYKGTAPSLVKAAAAAALTFWSYEAACRALRLSGWAWALSEPNGKALAPDE